MTEEKMKELDLGVINFDDQEKEKSDLAPFEAGVPYEFKVSNIIATQRKKFDGAEGEMEPVIRLSLVCTEEGEHKGRFASQNYTVKFTDIPEKNIMSNLVKVLKVFYVAIEKGKYAFEMNRTKSDLIDLPCLATIKMSKCGNYANINTLMTSKGFKKLTAPTREEIAAEHNSGSQTASESGNSDTKGITDEEVPF